MGLVESTSINKDAILSASTQSSSTASNNGVGGNTPNEHTVTAALIAIVVFGTGLVFVLLLCYACVLRRLCCPDFGRSKSSQNHHRSTTTQHTSCDVTKLDTLTLERSPS